MDSELQDMFIDVFFLKLCKMYTQLHKNKRTRRRWKTRPINTDYQTAGYHRKVFLKIKEENHEEFFEQTRMTKNVYDLLISLIGKGLVKKRQKIDPEERLAITLQFLAHGTPIQTIAKSHKLGKETVRLITLETCELIWDILSPLYLSEPTTYQYEYIANKFHNMWNMPNCVGALDGKHISLKCTKNAGSKHLNSKKHQSVVLMATCDADYIFTACSVGTYGDQHDGGGGIFSLTPFGKSLANNTLPLPPNKVLPGTNTEFPHFFVGDVAFPLKENLMRPYAVSNDEYFRKEQSNLNYRLSRAHSVIENAFGILCARWRILLNSLEMAPENAKRIVLACVALHNFIMLNDDSSCYCPPGFVDGAECKNNGNWRREIAEHGQRPLKSYSTFNRRPSMASVRLRDVLAIYLSCEGYIDFQETMNITTNE